MDDFDSAITAILWGVATGIWTLVIWFGAAVFRSVCDMLAGRTD